LQQVFVNLLVNAAKYTPATGKVLLKLERKDGQHVLSLADNGVGMSQDLQSRVFQPFVQADETLDRSEGGMGLGLALVKSLVELHGGEVAVSSEGEGHGCTFTVTLPDSHRTPTSKKRQPPEVETGEPKSLNILIVEDNADAREMLQLLLECDGHQVTSVGDGHAAIASIEDLHPDVALVDIGLPRLDGYQVAQRIRETLSDQQPFLVALTGYGQPSDREKTREAGFDAHLTKPVDIGELKSTLLHASLSQAER
jgi:CheY-like chemotaxis protein/anti-sigma regulatory factor (Ser/Thr protein kinase)